MDVAPNVDDNAVLIALSLEPVASDGPQTVKMQCHGEGTSFAAIDKKDLVVRLADLEAEDRSCELEVARHALLAVSDWFRANVDCT